MRGIMLKNHYTATLQAAYLVSEVVRGIDVFGAIGSGIQVCVPKDASEQGFLDGLPRVNRHHGSSLGGRLDQDQVAAFLPIFNESGAL